ncbi:hypothetical protein N9J03_04300 [Flavobacteriaceae bacterium]|nr:hypothetical protein [Flavobacteriaceae bacterium]
MEEHYLSKWMEGSVGDAEIVERDGAEALKNYQSILKGVDDLKVSIPESLEWEKFSQQLKSIPKNRKNHILKFGRWQPLYWFCWAYVSFSLRTWSLLLKPIRAYMF